MPRACHFITNNSGRLCDTMASVAPKKPYQSTAQSPAFDSNASSEYFENIENSREQLVFSGKSIEYRSNFFISNQQSETAKKTVAGIYEFDLYDIISAISRSKKKPLKTWVSLISACGKKNMCPSRIICRGSCDLSEAA